MLLHLSTILCPWMKLAQGVYVITHSSLFTYLTLINWVNQQTSYKWASRPSCHCHCMASHWLPPRDPSPMRPMDWPNATSSCLPDLLDTKVILLLILLLLLLLRLLLLMSSFATPVSSSGVLVPSGVILMSHGDILVSYGVIIVMSDGPLIVNCCCLVLY